MMAEDAKGDIENPNLPPETSPPSSDVAVTGRKWKWIGLGTFLLIAVVMSIALGVTLGGDGGGTSTSENDALGGASTSENDALDDAGEFGWYILYGSRDPHTRKLDANETFSVIAPIDNMPWIT
jgi:hypothetical protein